MNVPEEGLNVTTEALGLARTAEAGLFEPGLFQTKGELLFLQGASNAAEAEDCFRKRSGLRRARAINWGSCTRL